MEKMKDGTEATLSLSGDTYVRYTPETGTYDEIVYYDIVTKEEIPRVAGTCNSCGEYIESKYCGQFVMCKCEKSYVDTDRWFPGQGRYGGDIKPKVI